MNKLLIICGPTATGKTNLALQLIKALPGEIISADSRQVYKGMDIGTGKDKPADGTKIWGYDLVEPNEEFSVAHFYHAAWKVIHALWSQNKLPIIVGGTGQYLDNLLNPSPSIAIPPNTKLRQELAIFSLLQLQKKLQQVDRKRFQQMNYSDQRNPRRLIRAIEIGTTPKGVSLQTRRLLESQPDTLWIGLTAPQTEIDQKINQRVLDRAKNNMTAEIKTLTEKYPDWSFPAFSGTGYRQWREFMQGKVTQEEAIRKWQLAERQYARRQVTWFKRNSQINWYDITSPSWKKNLVQAVKNWYAIR